jgi:hypothetical protein
VRKLSQSGDIPRSTTTSSSVAPQKRHVARLSTAAVDPDSKT